MRKPATVLLFISLLALVLLAVLGLVVWESTGYSASAEAQETLKKADVDTDDWYAFGADDRQSPSVGVVLYPGGHVSADAYALVAQQLAEESGALVAVTHAPLTLPLLDQDAAADVFEAYPDVERWVVGGHSLGGVAAASFAEDDPRVDGLLLWASYPSGGTDLSDKEIEATSILGSRDGLLDSQSFEEARTRLPVSTAYVEVEGANHAYFGDYGAQSGDGEPAISREEAWAAIISASSDLIKQVRQAGSEPCDSGLQLRPQPLVLRRRRVDPNLLTDKYQPNSGEPLPQGLHTLRGLDI